MPPVPLFLSASLPSFSAMLGCPVVIRRIRSTSGGFPAFLPVMSPHQM